MSDPRWFVKDYDHIDRIFQSALKLAKRKGLVGILDEESTRSFVAGFLIGYMGAPYSLDRLSTGQREFWNMGHSEALKIWREDNPEAAK
jgi:hypothetical protein